MTRVRLKPAAPQSQVKQSTTEPLHSLANLKNHLNEMLIWWLPGCVSLPDVTSYNEDMSAHVLLNLLNKLGKRDKM